MIDVILYGNNRAGRLTARECQFRSLRGLVHFFDTPESAPWDWAEVARVGPDGRTRYVRLPSESLRSMIATAGPEPIRN